MASNDSNNSLYFIVGGLVVIALIFGFFFFNPNKINMDAPTPQTTSAPNKSTGQTDVQINENGASVTHTESR